MSIEHTLIHNFRGVIHQEFTLNPYTLLIGGNNAGKRKSRPSGRRFCYVDYLTYSMTTRRLGSVPVEWVVMFSISCRAEWIR